MNCSTTYLGLQLPHPLIVGAGPLADDLARVRQLEDAGAAALVLRSLYEEDITGEQMGGFYAIESHQDSYVEARSFIPEPEFAPGPDEYLEHLRRVKAAVGIPVIASPGTCSTNSISLTKLSRSSGSTTAATPWG